MQAPAGVAASELKMPRGSREFRPYRLTPESATERRTRCRCLWCCREHSCSLSGMNPVALSSVAGHTPQARSYSDDGFPNASSTQQRHHGHSHKSGHGGPSRKRDHSGQSDPEASQGHRHQQGNGRRRGDKRSSKETTSCGAITVTILCR